MKSSIISSAASSKTPDTASSSYTAGGARYRSEGRDDSSCYFPGCRKDTNCNCKMCLASISATLDLIPTGSSITKLSYSPKRAATPPARLVMEPATPPARPVMEPATPPAFPDHLIPSQSFSLTPPIESKAKSHPQIRGIPGDKGGFWVIVHWKLIVFVGIFLFTAVELGFLKGVEEGFGPRLAKEILEQFVEESGCKAVDLRATLRVLELKIGGVVDGDVLNCSSLDAAWEMKQSSDGKLDAISRTGNGSSWNLKRWNAVAMQLENNTWVVEYKRRAMFEDPKLLPAALDVLRLRSIKMFKLVKQETWRLLTIGSVSYAFYQPEEVNLMHPT